MRKDIDVCSLWYLLNYHTLPFPYTVYKGKYESDPYTDENGFIFDIKKSKENSNPDTKILKEKLVKSVERSLDKYKENILMLSSGKDSIAILSALAELGYKNVQARTFSTKESEDESVVGEKFAKKLGIKHTTIKIKPKDQELKNLLYKYFAEAEEPIMDQAFIPYLSSLKDIKDANILDGNGNDVYFGMLHPKQEEQAFKIIKYIRKLKLERLFRIVPPSNRVSVFSKDIYAPCLDGVITTRSPEKYLVEKIDLGNCYSRWENMKDADETDYINFGGYVRGGLLMDRVMMGKAKVAASVTGNDVSYPLSDKELASYCFNLPENYKFDRYKLKNKLLLRDMLYEDVGYDASKVGKRGFRFDSKEFIEENEKAIRRTIKNCNHLNLVGYYNRLIKNKHRYFESQEIIHLLLLVGWLNEGRFWHN